MKTYSRKTATERVVNDLLLTKVTPAKKTKITDYFFREPGVEKAFKAVKEESAGDRKFGNPNLQQTFLDLGQRDLFITSCLDCGMRYDRSFASDLLGKAIWKDEYSNGDVIAVIPGSSHCKELIDRVNALMEAIDQSLEDVQTLRVYLFVRNSRISGVMATERVLNATRESSADGKQSSAVEQQSDVSKQQNCLVSVGISRIWVNSTFRKMGIALRLLRAIRKCSHQCSVQCTTDCTVDPCQVAFSQPTSQGKSLAIKFLDQNGDYIVY